MTREHELRVSVCGCPTGRLGFGLLNGQRFSLPHGKKEIHFRVSEYHIPLGDGYYDTNRFLCVNRSHLLLDTHIVKGEKNPYHTEINSRYLKSLFDTDTGYWSSPMGGHSLRLSGPPLSVQIVELIMTVTKEVYNRRCIVDGFHVDLWHWLNHMTPVMWLAPGYRPLVRT